MLSILQCFLKTPFEKVFKFSRVPLT